MMRKAFYYALRTYVYVGIWFFYNRWQVVHLDRSAIGKPTIFASNHQNSFMDPLDIVFSQFRITVFLTRAKAFSTPIARGLFHLLFMLPIYRANVDGKDQVSKNDAIMNQSANYLVNNEHPIGIYVEGNHQMKRSLRPLKKGICRLAFEAMDIDPSLDLQIVPAGMNYSNHTAFRSDLLVIFGRPIAVADYYPTFLENPAKAYADLLLALERNLREIIIDIPQNDRFEEICNKWRSIRYSTDDLYEDFVRDKALIEALENNRPTDELLANRPPDDKGYQKLLKWAFFPVYLYAKINNIPGFYLAKLAIKKIDPVPAFQSSFKLVMGTFLIPLVYLLQAVILYMLSGDLKLSLLYFFTLPLFSLIYFKVYRKAPFK